jgi:hypothetical protein
MSLRCLNAACICAVCRYNRAGMPNANVLYPFILRVVILNVTARFLAYWLIIEGTTEKVLQFIMHSSQFRTKTLVSLNKECFLNTTEKFKH